MLITLKEAARWADENLNIHVSAATLRSACVDQRLKASQEKSATGRRGQPCEWKVNPLDLAIFLTSKYRSRRSRSAKEEMPAVEPVPAQVPALVPAMAGAVAAEPAQVPAQVPAQEPALVPSHVRVNPVSPVVVQPGSYTRPRYKVLELILQPTIVDFERHEVYDMRVIKKNIPRHAAAEKLAVELATRALHRRMSHQLRYVIEEYQSAPRRK